MRRLAVRHGWTVGTYVLLAVLVVFWRSQTHLPWGPFDVQSLAIDALPLAFVACGQAIVILSGGIDLSVGSMMSLVNVVAASPRPRPVGGTGRQLDLAPRRPGLGRPRGALYRLQSRGGVRVGRLQRPG